MKFFTQSFSYDDPWSIVSLAFFLRYPNPYAAHVLSCDVISRDITPQGTLRTTRLILKRGALPRWAPRGIVSRAESWIVEESEVDPHGKTVRCTTRNLDHVKVMKVEEWVEFRETSEGLTIQTTEARIFSSFGWGFSKNIESHGLSRFKANVQRSREGVSLILSMLRQARLQTIGMGAGAGGGLVELPLLVEMQRSPHVKNTMPGRHRQTKSDVHHYSSNIASMVPASSYSTITSPNQTRWQRFKSWFISSST